MATETRNQRAAVTWFAHVTHSQAEGVYGLSVQVGEGGWLSLYGSLQDIDALGRAIRREVRDRRRLDAEMAVELTLAPARGADGEG
jgi:hypothetical protein